MPPLGAALASSLLAQWQQEGRNSWVGFWRGEGIFPYALAQLSARFKERGHSLRAASTCRLRVSGCVCVYQMVIPGCPSPGGP